MAATNFSESVFSAAEYAEFLLGVQNFFSIFVELLKVI